jgi:hypothetical protein
MKQRVFVIGSSSIAGWLPEFCGRGRHEAQLLVPDGLAELEELELPGRDRRDCEFVFISGHSTLSRDRGWAARLGHLGYGVRCQSAPMVALGHDKVVMKRGLERAGIPTLPWRAAHEYSAGWTGAPGVVVVKRRSGTQSEGMRIAPFGLTPAEGEYCERYQDGVEYSVNVFAHGGRAVALPPVWKGPTSPELVPPWRRTRISAPEFTESGLAATMERIAIQIARQFEADGFLEVEFLVPADGLVVVLEVNPRVSGTLRISALAAREPVFGWYDSPPVPPSVPARSYAVEVPNPGPHIVLPALGLYATSRVTVAGDSREQLAARLDQIRDAVPLHSAATAELDEAVQALPGLPLELVAG